MSDIKLLTDDEAAPEEATHRIDISIYIKVESDEKAAEIANTLLEGAAEHISVILNIPEIVSVEPHITED
ncbi:unnamed protein product [marine sediment metagenome]|uniref:Uncharacterized protein n=1 Tax=marine sediment metagenome TaxID=412755 RepID=X0RJE3_9ZZZZ